MPGNRASPSLIGNATVNHSCGNPEVSPVITAAKLRTHTVKDLAAMAKRKGIPGWHAMRKEQLVRALVKRAKTAGNPNWVAARPR